MPACPNTFIEGLRKEGMVFRHSCTNLWALAMTHLIKIFMKNRSIYEKNLIYLVNDRLTFNSTKFY